MKPEQLVRSTVSTALTATARVLSAAAEVTTEVARRARPGGRGAQHSPRRPAPRDQVQAPLRPEEVATELPKTEATVAPPPTEPVPAGPSRVRSPETHVAELAGKTAAEVVDEIPTLSTDGLRLLYEHETEHKNRKTVLQAIEKALSPV